jgi:hypothetical protein
MDRLLSARVPAQITLSRAASPETFCIPYGSSVEPENVASLSSAEETVAMVLLTSYGTIGGQQ